MNPIENSAEDNPKPLIQDPFPVGQIDENQPIYLGREFQFKFHGKAMEYFGIWIVNILLTIATLSLYAPWAKVRRLRYFYGNTEFFERFFDFTGIPMKILIGRLIAIGIWTFFAITSYMDLWIAAFGILVIYIALPWLVRATIRFNSRNSKFGNSRFYFSGTNKEAYKQFIFALLITIFSLGILFPVSIWIYKKYLLNHLYVGQLKFQLNNSWTSYMGAVYFPLIVFWLVIMVFVLAAVFLTSMVLSSTQFLFGLLTAFYVAGILFIGPIIQARIFIRTWNSTSLGNSQFKTSSNQWRYAWIVGSNWIARIISLGLLSAWAAIRLYRYQVDSLTLTLNDDPNLMINIAQSDHSALAEEISDIFDIDISL